VLLVIGETLLSCALADLGGANLHAKRLASGPSSEASVVDALWKSSKAGSVVDAPWKSESPDVRL